MRKIGATLVAVVALLVSTGAQAQDSYPNKPIRLIVGFAAGGGNDILARIFNTKLSEALGLALATTSSPASSTPS
jgi:tripartite-type tricarboxylate transporter receptor subunit TctC